MHISGSIIWYMLYPINFRKYCKLDLSLHWPHLNTFSANHHTERHNKYSDLRHCQRRQGGVGLTFAPLKRTDWRKHMGSIQLNMMSQREKGNSLCFLPVVVDLSLWFSPPWRCPLRLQLLAYPRRCWWLCNSHNDSPRFWKGRNKHNLIYCVASNHSIILRTNTPCENITLSQC